MSVIKQMNENEIITREINPENGAVLYYVREELKGLMNWQIQKEKKNILGHTCQKAIGNYRGRSYVAYFSSKLAVPDGPFKFFNLPGLIFEIHSNDGFVKFSINSIKKVHLNIDHSSFDDLKSQYITYELFKKQLKGIMTEKSKKYNAKGNVDEIGFKSSVSFDIERIEKE
ncbi:GLPGLI family protein [Aquirufa aurantiipilula]